MDLSKNFYFCFTQLKCYDISKLPTQVLISREGVVEYHDPRRLEDKIRTLLYGHTEGKINANSLKYILLSEVTKNKKVIFCCIALSIMMLYLVIRGCITFFRTTKGSRRGVKKAPLILL